MLDFEVFFLLPMSPISLNIFLKSIELILKFNISKGPTIKKEPFCNVCAYSKSFKTFFSKRSDIFKNA